MTEFYLAFRNLFRYKKRLVLNLILIFYSTIFLVYCITIINTNKNTGKISAVNTITGHFEIKPKGNPDELFEYISPTEIKFFNKNDYAEIKKYFNSLTDSNSIKKCEAISDRIVFCGMVTKKEKSTPCTILGINPVDEASLCPDLSASLKEAFSNPGSIAVSKFIAKKLDLKLGDKIIIMNKTTKDGLRSMTFVFRGIISPKVMMDQNIQPLVYTNIESARYLLDVENEEMTQIAVRLNDKYYNHGFMRKIKKDMDSIKTTQKLKLVPYGKEIYFLEGGLKTAYIMAYSEAAIFIIIMIVGLVNITAINFRNQKKEIGTLMSLGMSQGKVFMYFLFQTLILVSIGYLIGSMAMIFTYYYLINIFKDGISLARVEMLQYAYGGKIIYPKLDFPGMIAGYLFFIIAGTIAVSGICNNASKLSVIDALREDKK